MITEVGHCRASLSFFNLNKVLISFQFVILFIYILGWNVWEKVFVGQWNRWVVRVGVIWCFFFIFLCAECRMSPNSTLRALDQWRFMSSCVFRHIPHTSHQGRILYSRFNKIAAICLLPSFNQLLHIWTGSSIKQPTFN